MCTGRIEDSTTMLRCTPARPPPLASPFASLLLNARMLLPVPAGVFGSDEMTVKGQIAMAISRCREKEDGSCDAAKASLCARRMNERTMVRNVAHQPAASQHNA